MENMKKIYLSLFLSLCLFYSIQAIPVPVPGFRPPAIPLIVSDPYFSVWAASDNLTDTWSSLWDGTTKAFTGMIRIDGNIFRFMGPSGLGGNIAPNAMDQISVTVYPTNTVFLFQAGGVQLTLTFTTPLLPSSLDLLSRPVTYLTYEVQSIDGNKHDVQIYYDNSAEIAVNTVDQLVNWGTNTTKGNLRDLYIGTSTQNILQNSGDRVGIDWGYFHVATDASDSSVSYSLNLANTLRSSFASNGNLPSSQMNGPLACNNGWPALAIVFNLGSVSSSPVEKVLLLAYDDIYALNFFGTYLKSYWTTLYSNFDALLDQAWSDYSDLVIATNKFDATTVSTMQQIGGNEYATLTALAYRQCVGGTKMTWNPNTNSPWYFMKEISSDGDVSTVDVVFPASPLFLYFNASLLGLQLLPIFAYANNETSNPYSLVWAPHHLGTWPIANIQTSQQENMPIEETANIILMVAAIAKYAPEFDTILKTPAYWALLQQWGDYLVSVLPDPGDQLCTDDFEGPTPHDANLAVKGILGIAAFGQLNAIIGNQTAAKKYLMIADQYVQNWTTLANPDNSDHYRLRYDEPGWSLKYNMVFQNILNLFVFPSSVMENEIAYYLQNLHPYGIPLDVRSDYSKLDWQSWVAAQGSDTDFAVIINSIYQFAQYTPQRVPLSDWYYTTQPNQQGFQARTVVGGLYAKAVFA